MAEEGVPALFAQYTRLPWLGAQHPPLQILLNGFVLKLLGDQLYYARVVTLLYALATVLLTYLVGRRLYDGPTGLVAAFALVTFPLFMRLGTVFMLDVQVTCLALLTVYWLCRLQERPSYGLAVAAGLSLGLGLLTKYTIVLMLPVILSYFLIHRSLMPMLPKLAVTATLAAKVAPSDPGQNPAGVMVAFRLWNEEDTVDLRAEVRADAWGAAYTRFVLTEPGRYQYQMSATGFTTPPPRSFVVDPEAHYAQIWVDALRLTTRQEADGRIVALIESDLPLAETPGAISITPYRLLGQPSASKQPEVEILPAIHAERTDTHHARLTLALEPGIYALTAEASQ